MRLSNLIRQAQPKYNVGDIINDSVHGLMLVTLKDSNIKNGRPGYEGVKVNKRGNETMKIREMVRRSSEGFSRPIKTFTNLIARLKRMAKDVNSAMSILKKGSVLSERDRFELKSLLLTIANEAKDIEKRASQRIKIKD